jgi:hypothetical protein
MNADPVRDVTVLMMVRHMPDEDFLSLCEVVLNADPDTLGSGEISAEAATVLDAMRRHAPKCDVCGELAPQSALTIKVKALAGVTACKRCVDDALGSLFGDMPQPTRLAVQLSVIGKRLRRARRVAA